MKKILVVFAILAGSIGSTFAQGYFVFNGGKSSVWDVFSTSSPHLASTMNVSFLWGTGTALVSTYENLTPTNGLINPPLTPVVWSDILNDPIFHIAVDATTGAFVSTPVNANGSFIYNGGGTFPVTGTTANQIYSLVEFAWDKSYATPQAAAAANAAVGWSEPITFQSVTVIGTTILPFPIRFGVYPVVPEPAVATLAALGGIVMLLAGRQK